MIGPKVVAIVAADEPLRRSLAFLLEIEGYRTMSHSLLTKGLRRIATMPTDCVIVDADIAGFREAERDLRSLGVPLILLTSGSARPIPHAIRLQKPVLGQALLDIVASAIQGRALPGEAY